MRRQLSAQGVLCETADKLVNVGIVVLSDNPSLFGPQELQMGKGRRGITPCGGCSTLELLPYKAEQIGFEPTTSDNPQLRPIKSVSGQGAIWIALSLYRLSYSRRNAKADLNCQPTVFDNP
jgi:hypothetical protein